MTVTPPDIKYPYKASVNWSFMQIMDIEDSINPNKTYLRRLILFKTPLCAVYIHWIYTPDRDRDMHNHPMNFWSWVIKGGYLERRMTMLSIKGFPVKMPSAVMTRERKRWSIARTVKTDFHSITNLSKTWPTVTVLFCGRRTQDWGFITNEGFVDQTTYRTQR